MRVALLLPSYWPEVRRGSERIVHDVGAGAAAAGHDVRLLTSHRERPTTRKEDGITVRRAWRPPERIARRLGYPPHCTHAPQNLASLLVGRDDVAHTFHPADAAAAARWSGLRRRPAVFSVMGIPRAQALRAHRRSYGMWRRGIDGADAVVALSAAAARAVEAELGVEARVIYPGVDLERFRPGVERHPEPTIFCAGAMEDRRKRLPLLFAAFALVRRQRPDARLVVKRPGTEALVREAQEAVPGIELVDPGTDPDALRRLYGEAWVSALASFAEAFGLVYTEALACGTPVVGADDGGVPEIVDRPDVGRLFDGDDPAAVATALLEALELAADPATAAACRTRAEAFSTQRQTDAHLALYRELVER